MPELSPQALAAYRQRTYCSAPGNRLASKEEAIAFVNRRGFVYFWPIKGVTMPSLWAAVAGDRPVADAHDDPGHITWDWKDSLLGQRAWYYAKLLRQKATMVSLEMAPYFYALSENYGAPEEDYLLLYQQGRLTQEARSVYEALLDKGPLDTLALRKAARLTSNESEARFNSALAYLQAAWMVVPVGVSDVGAWHYAFRYDLAARVYPEIPEKARFIGELDARQRIAAAYLESVGAAQVRDLTRLFGWAPAEALATLEALVARAALRRALALPAAKGEWFAVPELAGEPRIS